MSRRNTISREFFATIAAVLVLGLSVMCAIQTVGGVLHRGAQKLADRCAQRRDSAE
jgi:hypothetical protein